MALSNSTLSGCCVSLVIGLSYFLRRMPHAAQQDRQRADGTRYNEWRFEP